MKYIVYWVISIVVQSSNTTTIILFPKNQTAMEFVLHVSYSFKTFLTIMLYTTNLLFANTPSVRYPCWSTTWDKYIGRIALTFFRLAIFIIF